MFETESAKAYKLSRENKLKYVSGIKDKIVNEYISLPGITLKEQSDINTLFNVYYNIFTTIDATGEEHDEYLLHFLDEFINKLERIELTKDIFSPTNYIFYKTYNALKKSQKYAIVERNYCG